MHLFQLATVKKSEPYNIRFSLDSSALLMVSLARIIEDSTCTPSYWRIVNDNRLPLEIGIDTNTGKILCITLFAKKNDFIQTEALAAACPQTKGDIIFDTSIFKKKWDFIDVAGSLGIGITNKQLFCSFMTSANYKQAFKNDRLCLFVNPNNCLSAFSISNMSKEETRLLHNLA